MGSITVIGSLNMDLVVRADRIPAAGETLAGSDFHLFPGGKGANQAVAASRAGATTCMIGCVGNDAFGPMVLTSLGESGVDISGVATMAGISTGSATIIIENSGENRIIVVPGANGLVSPSYVESRWEDIKQSGLILLQHEIPLETVQYILERSLTENIPVVLNPAPFYPISPDLIPAISILILNEVEAAGLTGDTINDQGSAMRAARRLVKAGVKTVIITLGPNGTVLKSSEEELFLPAFKVDVVDTTAAGDTFAGSYAAWINKGEHPSVALRYASAAAALAVGRLGAQTSIPWQEEVQTFLSSHLAESNTHDPVLKNGGVSQS